MVTIKGPTTEYFCTGGELPASGDVGDIAWDLDATPVKKYIWNGRGWRDPETTKSLKSLAASGSLSTDTYVSGDTPDITGLSFTATYSDNSTASVDAADIKVSPHVLIASDTAIVMTYTEDTFSASVAEDITVYKKAEALVIVTDPDKMEYVAGETFDATGLKVMAFYTDGTSDDVTADLTVTVEDPLTEGEQTVTLTLTQTSSHSVSTTLTITVTAE